MCHACKQAQSGTCTETDAVARRMPTNLLRIGCQVSHLALNGGWVCQVALLSAALMACGVRGEAPIVLGGLSLAFRAGKTPPPGLPSTVGLSSGPLATNRPKFRGNARWAESARHFLPLNSKNHTEPHPNHIRTASEPHPNRVRTASEPHSAQNLLLRGGRVQNCGHWHKTQVHGMHFSDLGRDGAGQRHVQLVWRKRMCVGAP